MVAHRDRTGALQLWSRRIDSAATEPEIDLLDCYPVFADGVVVIPMGERRLGERIWVGGVRRGIEVTRFLHFYGLESDLDRRSLFPALRAINGRRSIRSIALSLSLDSHRLLRLMQRLLEEKLVHFHLRPISDNPERTRSRSRRLASGAAQENGTLQALDDSLRRKVSGLHPTRREVELSALPHGASMQHRATTRIEIIGHDRTATLVAALLYGSGVGRVQMTSDNDGRTLDEQIEDIDLGPGVLNVTDIGAIKGERFHEIEHRSAINPGLDEATGSRDVPYLERAIDADLVISIGYPRMDHHQRLISEDRPFLIVPGYQQGIVSIGPFVIPGSSPCLRCFELTQVESSFWTEQARQIQTLLPSGPSPQIATHLTATMTAEAVMRWIDFPDSRLTHPLLGRELILAQPAQSEADPVGHYRKWQTHPECGCT